MSSCTSVDSDGGCELGAADPDPLVLVGVVADDPGALQLVDLVEQVDVALDEPERPQQPGDLLELLAVVLGQLVLGRR